MLFSTMNSPTLILFFLLLLVYIKAELISKDSKVYGPFTVKIKGFDPCSGPKSVNLTSSYDTTYKTFPNNTQEGTVHILFPKTVIINEIKITVHIIEGKQSRLGLWNYRISNPCQHFVFGGLITFFLKTDQKCAVKKGKYTITIPIQDITKKFLGNSFFYGEYMFKAIGLAKNGNIICIRINSVITPSEGKSLLK